MEEFPQGGPHRVPRPAPDLGGGGDSAGLALGNLRQVTGLGIDKDQEVRILSSRNGPAQISFGSPRRILTSWLDGFAKLHSFKEMFIKIETQCFHNRTVCSRR